MKRLFYSVSFIISSLIVVSACKKETPEEVAPDAGIISVSNVASWNIASVPLRYAESALTNNTAYGFNRAKIAWYNIDPLIFYSKSFGERPVNITNDDMSADDCRVIYENELFPVKENKYNQPLYLHVFNIDYYPSDRGMYNFDSDPSAYSAGIGYDGKLNEPATRWAGITRKMEQSDKMKLNYLDFWLLDPFTTYPDAEGELYFDIGDISEDVLKDGLISAENTDGSAATTVWGLVKPLSGVNSFPSDPESQVKCDAGLDELLNKVENSFFSDYLNKISVICDPLVSGLITEDPAGDDFHSFLGKDYDQLNYKVRDRYKNIHGSEKNSPTNELNSSSVGKRTPDSEDINNNGKLDTLNNYVEYKIRISKESFKKGTNFITDVWENFFPVLVENGSVTSTKFYHFRIPLTEFSATYGTPDISANPKFLRLYFTGFSTPVNLRFITLEFSEEVINYSQFQNK